MGSQLNCITYWQFIWYAQIRANKPSTNLAAKFNNKILSLLHYELPIECEREFSLRDDSKWASCMNRQLIIIQTVWAWKFIGKRRPCKYRCAMQRWQIVDHRLHYSTAINCSYVEFFIKNFHVYVAAISNFEPFLCCKIYEIFDATFSLKFSRI